MRAYFIVLFGLLLMAVFVSSKIIATLPFDRPDHHMNLQSTQISNDNGTSACFEKRYSPQIRDCGGLLKYSAPTISYRFDAIPKQRATAKRRHLSARLAASERSSRSNATAGKPRHPSMPSHSDVAKFE
jgi:hypothetical protein